ncbi:MAG TPA: type III-B CRISPR module-associated Cmr3 family protein, partial [Myxococcota bacterium]|nr:type III-B CRISPR module-associated Cmr3 family protein [Myxococcota bacterium]
GSSSPWASPEPEALPPGETFAESGWISARNLLWALLGRGRWDPAGATPPLQKRAQGGSDLPPFVDEERRAGVAIDDGTRRALDHMLYTSTRHRFAPDTGLWGALEGAPASAVDALGEGPASLGRRQGQVTLGALPAIDGWSELIDGTHLRGAVGRHLRVVLLTPAEVPPRGSWPFPVPRGAEVRGAIARAGRPIGGFEQGKGGRPTRTTWAAGSTWWVELTREIADVDLARAARDLLLPLHDHERFGFALRAVAPFDPLTGTPELPHA